MSHQLWVISNDVIYSSAVKIGSAAAHAGGEITKKAQDGSLTNQGSAAIGSAFGICYILFKYILINY